MDQTRANHRTDAQLEAILCETGHWVVNGQQGQPLCFATSLRQAIYRSVVCALSGSALGTICRLPSDNIIVLPPQFDRIRKIIAGRETPAIVQTKGRVAAEPARRMTVASD
jgi:hypothetical protein